MNHECDRHGERAFESIGEGDYVCSCCLAEAAAAQMTDPVLRERCRERSDRAMAELADLPILHTQPVRRFSETRRLHLSYLFAIRVPRCDEFVQAMAIYNDPFVDAVWIGRAHVADECTLAQRLCEECQLEVWMLPRGRGKARRVLIEYRGLRSRPLELDASRDEIALEWVVLENARCSPAQDLAVEEWPRSLRDRHGLGGNPRR